MIRILLVLLSLAPLAARAQVDNRARQPDAFSVDDLPRAAIVNRLRLSPGSAGAPPQVSVESPTADMGGVLAAKGHGCWSIGNGAGLIFLACDDNSGVANANAVSLKSAPAGQAPSLGDTGGVGVNLGGAGVASRSGTLPYQFALAATDSALTLSAKDGSGVAAPVTLPLAQVTYLRRKKLALNPASGSTVTISTYPDIEILSGGATKAALTVVLPSSPAEGDEVSISSDCTITALTVSASGTIYGAPTTMSATTPIRFRWSTSRWVRVS